MVPLCSSNISYCILLQFQRLWEQSVKDIKKLEKDPFPHKSYLVDKKYFR